MADMPFLLSEHRLLMERLRGFAPTLYGFADRRINYSAKAAYLVLKVGFEPTHPKGLDLQSSVPLPLYRLSIFWWHPSDLNREPSRLQRDALPIELECHKEGLRRFCI